MASDPSRISAPAVCARSTVNLRIDWRSVEVSSGIDMVVESKYLIYRYRHDCQVILGSKLLGTILNHHRKFRMGMQNEIS